MADEIRATPRSPILGLFSDIVNLPLQYMSSPERTQQMQGAAQFLYGTSIPKTLERASYGESLFSGAGGLGGTTRMLPETANALLNVLPFAKPAAVIANRAAMTAGRAGARYAERVVPQVMERGGLPAQLLGDVSRGSVSPLDVYHGTPHTLPPTPRNPLGEFDASKIGTGEGAQAYGYGIYTAEARKTGERYRSQLAPERNASDLNTKMRFVQVGEKPINPDTFDVDVSQELIDAAKSGKKEFLDFANQKKSRWEQLAKDESYKFQPYAEEKVKAYDDLIKEAEKSGVKYTGAGNLYKIDLPDEKIASMLDWDKPLNEQNLEIQNIIKNVENLRTQKVLDARIQTKMDLLENNQNIDIVDRQIQILKEEIANPTLPSITGESYYKMLTNQLGDQKQASNTLNKLGISGIKYLDELSRGTKYKGDSAYLYAGKNFKENGYSLENALEGMKQAYKDANPEELKDALEAVYTPQTRNFVVFPNEEKSMTILERNDIPASQVDNPAFTDPFGNTIGSSIR